MNPKTTYSEKLKSPLWQKKRLEILARDEWRCVYCQDNETTLHVHHKKYSGKPWDAPSEDLETVCEYCHTIITAFSKADIESPVKAIKRSNTLERSAFIFSVILDNGSLHFVLYKIEKDEWDYGDIYFTKSFMANLIAFYQTHTNTTQ